MRFTITHVWFCLNTLQMLHRSCASDVGQESDIHCGVVWDSTGQREIEITPEIIIPTDLFDYTQSKMVCNSVLIMYD